MWHRRMIYLGLVLAGLLAAAGVVACGGAAPATAPKPEAATGGPLLVAHKAGETHSLQPKRLDAVIEVDMNEMYFANPQGEKNPVFRLPAGKTVGIHLHNEGTIMHEFAIGRKLNASGEYADVLTEKVPSDLFFYYGNVKAEVEDAEFGELEVEPGIRDIWLRLVIPPELKSEWEIGCFAEGHYAAGMKAKLIVE